jgi:hypothetical protein
MVHVCMYGWGVVVRQNLCVVHSFDAFTIKNFLIFVRVQTREEHHLHHIALKGVAFCIC